MSRRLRVLASLLAILSMAAAQLALSSYTCPGGGHGSMARTVASVPGDGAGFASLCAEHCRQGEILPSVHQPAPVPDAMAFARLRIDLPDVPSASARIVLHPPPLPPQPPPAILFAVLRI